MPPLISEEHDANILNNGYPVINKNNIKFRHDEADKDIDMGITQIETRKILN